jgi:hypothetical protein
MLEVDEVLHTWALGELPREWHAAQLATSSTDPTCAALADSNAVVAEQLGHHRKAYLEYEGPVSGDRGRVHRIDRGTYRDRAKPPGFWSLELEGTIVHGNITLEKDSAKPDGWFLRCEN